MFSIVKALLFFLLFIILYFIFFAIESVSPGRRVYAEIADDKKAALARWQAEHEGINPGDYHTGRMLAEDYEHALLALFRKFPDERENPKYRTEYADISALLSRKRTQPVIRVIA